MNAHDYLLLLANKGRTAFMGWGGQGLVAFDRQEIEMLRIILREAEVVNK